MRTAILLSLLLAAALMMSFTQGKIFSEHPDPEYKPKGFIREVRDSHSTYWKKGRDSIVRNWNYAITTRYDKSGRVTVKMGYDRAGKLLYIDTPSFDVSGNILTLRYYRGNMLSSEYNFSYDSLGRKTGYEVHNFFKKDVHLKVIFKYDQRNYCILKEIYKNNKVEKHVFSWDSAGNCTGFSLGNKSVWAYRYNDQKLRMEDSLYRNDTLIQIVKLHYDTYENIVHAQTYTAKGIIDTTSDDVVYHYRYDKHGNWIEKKMIGNGSLSSIETRKIIYYK